MNSICFLGNYAPRCCGIATFTQDLRSAVLGAQPRLEAPVVMVSDDPLAYSYPKEVRMVLDEKNRADYGRIARAINRSGASVVSLQHEFGIYGGPSGAWLVDLLRELRMPVVTTCHTVLKNPSPSQKHIMQEIARYSNRMVVMAEKGREFLRDIFEVPDEKITVVPHGIPDMEITPGEVQELRSRLGWNGRRVLLTFGLLSPNKGLEQSIRALPEIVRRHPDTLYVVVGATHPNLVREQGESYRKGLQVLAEELGVARHVQYINRFVSRDELVRLIAAADIYLTPYLNEAQITSGTLAFAFGLGKPVISTPYWHATELLADGAGVLVPFNDVAALAEGAASLMADDERMSRMAKNAWEQGRGMTWRAVGRHYYELFAATVPAKTAVPLVPSVPVPNPGKVLSVPVRPPELRQLERLTGANGIFQHAELRQPDPRHGFCTDDNARAAIFLTTCPQIGIRPRSPAIVDLAERSLWGVCSAFNPQNGRFRNFMDADGNWLEQCGSEDSHGRALWALGTVLAAALPSEGRVRLRKLFLDGCVSVPGFTSPRTWAFVLMGLAGYREVWPHDTVVRSLQEMLAGRLLDIHRRVAGHGWQWFENSVTYDNGKLPESLLLTYRQTQKPELRRVGIAALNFLLEAQIAPRGHFRAVGCRGFWQRGTAPAVFDQQPLEAQAMVAACLEAERATGERQWYEAARSIYAWFLGENDLGIPIADPATGGCHDGLAEGGLNLNQGAESTLAYLQATADMARATSTRPSFAGFPLPWRSPVDRAVSVPAPGASAA